MPRSPSVTSMEESHEEHFSNPTFAWYSEEGGRPGDELACAPHHNRWDRQNDDEDLPDREELSRSALLEVVGIADSPLITGEQKTPTDGRDEALRTLRKLDVPELRKHPLLHPPPPQPNDHQVIDQNEDQRDGAGLNISDGVVKSDNSSHDEGGQKSPYPNTGDGHALSNKEGYDYEDAIPELTSGARSNVTAGSKAGPFWSPVEMRKMVYCFVIWKRRGRIPSDIFGEHDMWPSDPSSTFLWRLMQISFFHDCESITKKMARLSDELGTSEISTAMLIPLAEDGLMKEAQHPPREEDDFRMHLFYMPYICPRKWLRHKPSVGYHNECIQYLKTKWPPCPDFEIAPLSRIEAMTGPELWLFGNLAIQKDEYTDALEPLEALMEEAGEDTIGIHHFYQVLVRSPYPHVSEVSIAVLSELDGSEVEKNQVDLSSDVESLSEAESVHSAEEHTEVHDASDSDYEQDILPGHLSQPQMRTKKPAMKNKSGDKTGYASYGPIDEAMAVWFYVLSVTWKLPHSRIFTSHEMWPFYVYGSLAEPLMRLSFLTDLRTATKKLEVLWQDPERKHQYAINRIDRYGSQPKRRIIKYQAVIKVIEELWGTRSKESEERSEPSCRMSRTKSYAMSI